MTLKRWITGKELMEYMDLTQHELYEFTVLGLPVYDGAGRFIINNMKPKTPGTITRLGAVYVDTGSKMFVDMIGYKKFKIDEVRGFLEERDLMHLIPKPAAAEPTQTPETQSQKQNDNHSLEDPYGITLEEVERYPREKLEILFSGKHKKTQIRTSRRALDALILKFKGKTEEFIYEQLNPSGESQDDNAARQARQWIENGRQLVLSERKNK